MSVEAGGVPALFTAWSQHGDLRSLSKRLGAGGLSQLPRGAAVAGGAAEQKDAGTAPAAAAGRAGTSEAPAAECAAPAHIQEVGDAAWLLCVVLDVAVQVGEALVFAHRRGVVHAVSSPARSLARPAQP
jgi:hypothetical protein